MTDPPYLLILSSLSCILSIMIFCTPAARERRDRFKWRTFVRRPNSAFREPGSNVQCRVGTSPRNARFGVLESHTAAIGATRPPSVIRTRSPDVRCPHLTSRRAATIAVSGNLRPLTQKEISPGTNKLVGTRGCTDLPSVATTRWVYDCRHPARRSGKQGPGRHAPRPAEPEGRRGVARLRFYARGARRSRRGRRRLHCGFPGRCGRGALKMSIRMP